MYDWCSVPAAGLNLLWVAEMMSCLQFVKENNIFFKNLWQINKIKFRGEDLFLFKKLNTSTFNKMKIPLYQTYGEIFKV